MTATDKGLEDRAAEAATAVLKHFSDLETLGAFAGEPVEKAKHIFLRLAFRNFASNEVRAHIKHVGTE